VNAGECFIGRARDDIFVAGKMRMNLRRPRRHLHNPRQWRLSERRQR
jgi:hypothetical protein